MTLFALLIALAQQGGQPATHEQHGVSQPASNDVSPDKSTASNTTDKAESLSPVHNTELQGQPPAKHAKKAKKAKAQGRSKKAVPEASPAPSAEKQDQNVEREAGKGKAPRQPKPLGEKSNQ
jgi:hypothetical protein